MFIVLDRGKLRTGLLAVCTMVTAAMIVNFAMHPNLSQWVSRGIVIQKVKTDQKVVALTFDDGPNPPATTDLLNLLAANHAKATFFVNGVHADRYPAVLKATYAAGHEIGNHGYSHQLRLYNDERFAEEDIKKNEALICSLTGQRTKWLRPPGGYLSNALVAFVERENMRIVSWTWNADFKDWKARDAGVLAGNLIHGIRPGYIVVLHDGGANRQVLLDALARALPELRKQGYRFVTVSELLTCGPPY